MPEKLKPCPFCGAEAKLSHIGNDHTKKRAAHIKCTTAGCVEIRVATLRHPGFDWCEAHVTRKWNNRAGRNETIEECAKMCDARNEKCASINGAWVSLRLAHDIRAMKEE